MVKEFWSPNITIDLKCGIHTGRLLFGLLDTDTRSEVTALGSTVNLAHRLVAFSQDDQIIISLEVKDLVKDKYSTNRIPVKNKIQSFPEVDFVFEVKNRLVA
jgi:class 3 adenylate cyclase